jgi:hypothetical protein
VIVTLLLFVFFAGCATWACSGPSVDDLGYHPGEMIPYPMPWEYEIAREIEQERMLTDPLDDAFRALEAEVSKRHAHEAMMRRWCRIGEA